LLKRKDKYKSNVTNREEYLIHWVWQSFTRMTSILKLRMTFMAKMKLLPFLFSRLRKALLAPGFNEKILRE